MAYVPVPKDLSQVKSKVIFNLTKRQLLCFGSGALVSVPLFFLLKRPLGTTTAAMAMMIVMLPFFLFALYEKYGQPLEKILANIIRVLFLRPKERPYQTNNYYAVLIRQGCLDKEVSETVQRDQRSAERNRTLAGLGIGGGAGAGLGALGAGKGARGPGALVGGLAGGLAGSLGGGILGAMKSNQILSEREPELYGQINDAYDEYDLAEERLDKHMTHSNPNLDIQRELLELKKQQLAQQQQGM